MAFYDRIAKKWHTETGFTGGAFKQLVLNNLLIDSIKRIEKRAILELGAGNGYFLPLVMRRYSGQSPSRLVITDQSERQLELARKHFTINGAEYALLDVRNEFAFQSATFDLIIATMVFNEIPKRGVASAVSECHRVLCANGQLLATVTHPAFVASLNKRGQLRRGGNRILTMPGAAGLRAYLQKRHTAQDGAVACLCRIPALHWPA
jgi:SAM-dependent methyltransferase